jgi:hypothetical protein
MATITIRQEINLFSSPDCNGLIRKLPSGEFRLYSRTKKGSTIILKNVGTYCSLDAARKIQQQL